MARQRGEDMTAEERRQRMARQIRKIEEECRGLLASWEVGTVTRQLIAAESSLRLAELRGNEVQTRVVPETQVVHHWPPLVQQVPVPLPDGSHDYPEQPRPTQPSGPIRAEEDGAA